MPQMVNLPSIFFRTKNEGTAYFKAMLSRYFDGEVLTPEDDSILFELLQRHPEATTKVGVGVRSFYRQRSPNHPTSCFHIERYDGSTTDFSYRDCIRGVPASLEQQFYAACRYSVSEKLMLEKAILFKDAGGVLKCEKTGLPITIQNSNYCHTDPTFREIVRNFITDYNIKIDSTMLCCSTDMQYVTTFADREIESLFKKYHTAKANMALFKK